MSTILLGLKMQQEFELDFDDKLILACMKEMAIES